MPTSNIPLSYAVNDNGVIHLYILLYSGSIAPVFKPESDFGNVRTYEIEKKSSGATKYFKHVSFAKDKIDTVEIKCDGHIRTIFISDFDTLTPPAQSGDQALDAPYSYTQRVDNDNYSVELVVFAQTAQPFACTHAGPAAGADPTDRNSDVNLNGANTTTEFSTSTTINLTNYVTSSGTHTTSWEVAGGPKRRSKTKNKYHSPTPFSGKKSHHILPPKH